LFAQLQDYLSQANSLLASGGWRGCVRYQLPLNSFSSTAFTELAQGYNN